MLHLQSISPIAYKIALLRVHLHLLYNIYYS